MGKPTGFLDYPRQGPHHRPVPVRLRDWREVYEAQSDDEVSIQGARCMDCGIPFCMQGCPLGNRIPTFNDHVFRTHWEMCIRDRPDSFLRDVFGDVVPPAGEYGIAHWMVPKNADIASLLAAIDVVLERVGLTSLGWRDVPVDSSVLGSTSLASEPSFVQQLIAKEPTNPAPDLERALYCARKVIEHTVDVYASSCSPHVLIYKGMLTAPQLRCV